MILRVFKSLAWFITLISVIVCLVSPILAVLMDQSSITISRIYRYPDGASVGIYMNDESHDTIGTRLVIRRRGFASIEGDTVYEPMSLIIFVIPPALWVLLNHYAPLLPRRRRLLPWCAASPFALTVMMIYIRKLDRMSSAVGISSLAVALAIGIVQTLRRRAQKRIARGLCPTCAYDLRATPEPGGPLLPRCPECGDEFSAPSAPPR